MKGLLVRGVADGHLIACLKLPNILARETILKNDRGGMMKEEQSGTGWEDTRCAPESGSSLPDRRVADTVLAERR